MTSSESHEMPSAESIEDAASEELEVTPTYAPAMMALGIMMLLWGITTMWIMSVAGLGLMTWSLWIWMNEIRQQWQENAS